MCFIHSSNISNVQLIPHTSPSLFFFFFAPSRQRRHNGWLSVGSLFYFHPEQQHFSPSIDTNDPDQHQQGAQNIWHWMLVVLYGNKPAFMEHL